MTGSDTPSDIGSEEPREPPAPPGGGWLTRGVLGIGGASLFSDAGHEMVTSLLPTFLSSTLHAGPGALGVIEGVSDALTGVSKLAGGPLANDPGRRSRLASGGYLGTAVATAAIGLTTGVWQVAILRALAWVSRGIRSPARDMLLTSLAQRDTFGRAFGVERAGDNAGAIAGPLLARDWWRCSGYGRRSCWRSCPVCSPPSRSPSPPGRPAAPSPTPARAAR